MSSARRRLPETVRAAAVRCGLAVAFTLVALIVATLASYAHAPLLVPALAAMALGVFWTVWCGLEVVIARQAVRTQRLLANR